jgi:prepilin-type N-terminal cleavage/methylation domain-containing protein
MKGRARGDLPGFTLLELLVVIGIIGVLGSLLLPALSRAKQQAKRVNEINAGRQLMLAWQMYADDNNDVVLPGYNSVFLGGDEPKFNPGLAAAGFGTDWLVTRATQIQRPSELLAFASARSRSGDAPDEPGYFVVYPPYLTWRQWEAGFQAASAPERWGYVHPRWNRRAVVALTDGHTETMADTELQDMRHWATPADRADWTLPRLTAR